MLIAVVLAAILRVCGIHARSLWGDEFISLAVATGHFWYPWQGEESALFYSADYYRDLLTLAPTYFSQRLHSILLLNDQAPLYYVLLNLWLHLVGTSEAGLRSLSLIASLLSIPLLYSIGRYSYSREAGIYAAWLFALTPFQVAFALYNRPYAWLGFFSILSALAAIHISRGSGKWLLMYAAAAILGIYTQYLFVWNVPFHIVLVTFYQRHNRPLLVRFGLGCLAVAAAALLWAPTFLEQARWSAEVGRQSWFYWYSGSSSARDGVVSLGRNALLLLTSGRVAGFCGDAADPDCQMDSFLTVISYVVPLSFFGLCGWRMVQHFRQSVRFHLPPNPWAVCLVWGGCVFAGPIIMDLVLDSHMVYSHRYFIAASGPVYLAVAVAVVNTNPRYLRWSMAAALLLFVLGSSLLYLRGSAATLMYEIATRDAARYIDQVSGDGPGDLILVLDPGLSPKDIAFYLRSNPDFARIHVPRWHSSAQGIQAQLHAIISAKRRARIWYLDDHGFERETHVGVLGWLRTHHTETEVRPFRNLSLFLFSPQPNDDRATLAEASDTTRRTDTVQEAGLSQERPGNGRE